VNLLKILRAFLESKVVRFLIVGCLNTLVGFLVFSIVIYFSDGNIGLSLAINIVVGIFFNYLSYGIAVFNSLGIKQFSKFIIAYGFIYMINYAVLRAMLTSSLNIYLAQFINLFYLAPISYFLFSKWVFSKSELKGNAL